MGLNHISSFQSADKIIFGVNSIESLGEILNNYNVSKTLIVTDKGVYGAGLIKKPKEIIESAGIIIDVISNVRPEPPISHVKELLKKIKDNEYDMLIGIGGGSSMDATKILSVLITNDEPLENFLGIEKIRKPGIPTLLIPTTAGTGSEVTPNAIVTDLNKHLKIGIVSRYLIATVVILDPTMTLGLPKHITASTGIDALTHSLESYISKKANLLSDMFSLKSIGLILKSIRTAYEDGSDINARNDMLIGSLLGGMALTSAGTAGVHALAYPLGGRYGVPHGIANSMMLIPVFQYNMTAVIDKIADIADLLDFDTGGFSVKEKAETVLEYLESLIHDLNIPADLKEYGVESSHLDDIADAAMKVTRLLDNNPKKLSREEIKNLYAKLL